VERHGLQPAHGEHGVPRIRRRHPHAVPRARRFTISRFAELQIGPVVLEDKLTYPREIRLLEPFRLDVQLAVCTPDVRKFKIRNRFFTAGETLCVTVDSRALWLDLAARQPIAPPLDLRDAWLSLERSEDFEDWS
jgi:acyl-CoA thioester hydrolase